MNPKWRSLKEAITYPAIVSKLIMAIGFAAVVVGLFYFDATSEKAIEAQTELEQEFHFILPPDGAIGSQYSASRKMQHALVSEKFKSTQAYQQIRDYYDDQFKKHGWQFLYEKPTSGVLKDSEERTLYYGKGDYTAALEFQNYSNSGYSYALNFSWGLH